MKSRTAPIASMKRPIFPPAARLYRFTVAEYDRMADVLEDRSVELIDGYVVKKTWIVNLVDRQVEVYTKPHAVGYMSRTIYNAGQAVPFVLDGKKLGRIPVTDILPYRS